MTGTGTDPIKVGDRVTYLAVHGNAAGYALGKVLGIFRTRDGKTLADVEWNRVGIPKRVSIERLTRFTGGDL